MALYERFKKKLSVHASARLTKLTFKKLALRQNDHTKGQYFFSFQLLVESIECVMMTSY